MKRYWLLIVPAALAAAQASAAPLTPDLRKDIQAAVMTASTMINTSQGRRDAADYIKLAHEECERAAGIAAGADPDPYVQGEVNHCRGDVAEAEHDAKACDYWMA